MRRRKHSKKEVKDREIDRQAGRQANVLINFPELIEF